MKNYNIKYILICLTLLLGFLEPISSQEFEIDPDVAIKVIDGFYIHPARGSYTTIFAGAEGLLLIDTGLEFEGAKSDSLIRSEFNRPVKYIINSHYHMDHAGGNKSFAHDGAIIIGHRNTRKEMQRVWKKPESLKMPVIQPYDDKALPEICFDDSLELHLNGEIIKLIHTPDAHTSGDLIVFFNKANVIQTGDIFITLNAFPPYEGSFDGLIRALDFVISRCDDNTIVIPSHGPVSKKEDVIIFKEILKKAHQTINDLKEKGKSFEEIVEAKPLDGLLTGKKYISDKMFIYSVYYGNW